VHAQMPIIPFEVVYMLKNDTIYSYCIYENREKIDSVIISDTLIRSLNRKYWFYEDNIASYECKFVKKKSSKWFLRHNSLYFNAESECVLKYRKEYFKDTSLIEIYGSNTVIYYLNRWWGWRMKVR
jgi:hypothetical protein